METLFEMPTYTEMKVTREQLSLELRLSCSCSDQWVLGTPPYLISPTYDLFKIINTKFSKYVRMVIYSSQISSSVH